MITPEERLVALEVKVEANEELLKEINKKVTALSEQLLKHKGFLGGVIFTVSALWAVILLAIDLLWKR